MSYTNMLKFSLLIVMQAKGDFDILWPWSIYDHSAQDSQRRPMCSVVGLESAPGLESIFLGLGLGLGLELLGLGLGP